MNTLFLILNFLMTLPLANGRKFKIRTTASLKGWPAFGTSKFISVFGVRVVAESSVCNKNFQYAANFLAQMLDSNEDGMPDDKNVLTHLRKRRSTLLIFSSEANVKNPGKVPYSYKTLVMSKCNNHNNRRKTLLAVSRLIAAFGLSPAYPRTLGDKQPSFLRDSLDALVGDCGYAYDSTLRWPDCTGHVFYNDSSCDMECMANEYLAELMIVSCDNSPLITSDRIGFWDIESCDDLIEKDPRGIHLVKKMLPQKTPNGNYRPGKNGYQMALIPFRKQNTNKIKGRLIEVKL